MELKRGRWSKKYINCVEDKRDYDMMCRGFVQAHELIAGKYCEKFSPPELTAGEKAEIDAYWAQFGIKIYDYNWHRMYYHATGLHDPRFIPDLVAGLVIYEYYNDHAFEDTWRDKNMFHRLLPDVPLPKELGYRIRGRFYHKELGYVSNTTEGEFAFANAIWETLGKEDDIIVKNTRHSGFGRGVKKYHITCVQDIFAVLKDWEQSTDYVMQVCVRQHKIFREFNESSTNMFRVCSFRHDNEVDILFAGARVGIPGSVTDVSFVDGQERVNLVGISNDGYFADKMLDQDGVVVRSLSKGVAVPAWEKIVKIIKQNHLLIDNFDIIGWDFTVDEDENPICFEWNISWPGTVLYQYANGPLYADKTELVLDFLKDEYNQFNYIPHYMRLK